MQPAVYGENFASNENLCKVLKKRSNREIDQKSTSESAS